MQTLGISFDQHHAYVSLVSHKTAEKKVLKNQIFNLKDAIQVKALYKLTQKHPCTVCITSKSIWLYKQEIPTQNRDLLEKILDLQTESYSFYPSTDSITALDELEPLEDNAKVKTLTITKGDLSTFIRDLENIHLDPEKIAPRSHCLYSYVLYRNPKLEDAILCDIQEDCISLIVIHQKKLEQVFCLDFGLSDLYQSLSLDKNIIVPNAEVILFAKQLDLLSFPKKTFHNFHKSLQKLTSSMIHAMFALHEKFGKKTIVFLGKIDAFSSVSWYLEDKLGNFLESSSKLYLPLEETNFAASIGAAINFQTLPNFRKQEFYSKKAQKKQAFQTLQVLILTLIVCIGSYVSFDFLIDEKIQDMKIHYFQKYTKANPAFAKSVFLESDSDFLLLKWQKLLSKYNQDNFYKLSIPNVSETLSFVLHTMQDNEALHLTDFFYEIIDMPSSLEKKKPFLGKISLEFTAKNIGAAKKFLQTLKENPNINLEEEISFEELEKLYRLSFFLRNQKTF